MSFTFPTNSFITDILLLSTARQHSALWLHLGSNASHHVGLRPVLSKVHQNLFALPSQAARRFGAAPNAVTTGLLTRTLPYHGGNSEVSTCFLKDTIQLLKCQQLAECRVTAKTAPVNRSGRASVSWNEGLITHHFPLPFTSAGCNAFKPPRRTTFQNRVPRLGCEMH